MPASPLLSRHADDFHFIEKTLTVLSVDNNPDEISDFLISLSQLRIFNVIHASTAREAVEVLSDTRVHVCLTELTVDDINRNVFYLPQMFSRSTHFLAISGEKSCAKGSAAIKNGFLDVIDKPVEFEAVYPDIFYHAVKNILAPTTEMKSGNAIDRSFDILVRKSPHSVGEWAGEMNLASCSLREIWEKKRGIPPKSAVFLWNLFYDAYLYYCNRYLEINGLPAPNVDIQKLHDIFFTKRSYWLDIINTPIHPLPNITIMEDKKPCTSPVPAYN